MSDPQAAERAPAHAPAPGGLVEPPRAAPPAQEKKPRTPSRAMSVGIVAVGVLTAVLGVLGALLVRRYTDGSPAAPDASAAAAGATGAPGGAKAGADTAPSAKFEAPIVRATVTPPDGQKAIVRRDPSLDAPIVAVLPAGTAIEMTKTVTQGGQTWCRVRTPGPPHANGWMHANVLRME